MPPHRLINIASTFLIAAVTPALVVAVLAGDISFATIVFIVASAHLVLAIPLYIFLKRRELVNVFSCMLSGFVVAVIPIGIWTWPLTYSEHNSTVWIGSKEVLLIKDGIPTLSGWIQYAEGLLIFGLFGGVAGFVFWHILNMVRGWRTQEASELSGQQENTAPGWRRYSLPIVAGCLVAGIMSVPTITKDRTCHNPFRDGGTSIGTQINIDLNINEDEWPALSQLFQELAEARKLSFRNDSELQPGVLNALYLSMCNESGVLMSTNEQKWYKSKHVGHPGWGVRISVYETSKGSNWRQLTRTLIDELQKLWPNEVRYRDEGGQIIAIGETKLEKITED